MRMISANSTILEDPAMRRILKVVLTTALYLSFFGPMNIARAQSVILPIENIPQETEVWCWAAVAQQIIYSARKIEYFPPPGPSNRPAQCELVARAKNLHPNTCCNQILRFNGINPYCHTTGSLQQIQRLIDYFGGIWSTLAPPTTPQNLYYTLQAGRPIILMIQNSPYSSHVVVLRGISFVNGVWMLHVNDPLQWTNFSQPVPYNQLLYYWASAIVIG